MRMLSRTHISRTNRQSPESGNALLWGCAALVAIMIFVLLGVGVAAYYGISAIRKYTSEEPIILPPVEATVEEIDLVIERIDVFMANLEEGETQENLILTEKDLNILIQHHDELEDIQDYVYLTLEGDEVTGQLSVPLSNIPGLNGRYFTGVATFDVEFEDERLEIYVQSAEINGETLPDKAMDQMRHENLAQQAQSENPEFRDQLRNIESIEIVDGQVIVVPREQ